MQHTIVDYNEDDYYQSAVIRPPKDFKFFEADTRHTRIIVDSRIRDKSLFPNPNNYEIPLEDDINDVREARLVSMEIPMPMYLINPHFNKLYFRIASIDYVATVPSGDYSAVELAAAIEAAMNELVPTVVVGDFKVTYNARLDNFEIRCESAFTLLFGETVSSAWIEKPNALSMLLGFSAHKNYYSEVDAADASFPNLVRSEYRRNFEYNNYLIMDIDQFDVLKSVDRDLNKSFAVIPKDYSLLNIADEASIIKTFSPPIGRLAKLRIKFYDRFGNPYDFQNMDHRFELIVTSFKQRRKYNM